MRWAERICAATVLVFTLSSVNIAGTTREYQTPDSVGLENGAVALEFSKQSGALTKLQNVATGDDYMKEPAGDGNPFRAYVDTTETPRVLAVAIPYPVQPVEGAMGGKLIDPKDCKLIESSFTRSAGGGMLRLVSRSETPPLRFELQVLVPDDDVAAELTLTVRNEDAGAHSVMAAVPYLTGLGLGAKRETNLGVRLVGYGQSRAPAWENLGDVNGRIWNGQWNAVYDVAANEGLGVVVKDPDLRNKVMRRFPPAGMSVFYPEKTELAAGQSVAYPTVQILVHQGNWKFVARRYRDWMTKVFPPHKAPAWLDDVDMQMGGAWLPDPADVARAKSPPDIGCDNRPVPPGVITSFRQLPRMFYYPCDLRSSSMYWQSVLTCNRWHAYDHTDGIYDIRTDLGGAEAYRDGIAQVKKIGRYYGLYVGVKTVRKDSRFLKNTNAQDWILMDTPERRVPEDGLSFYMCLGDTRWQDQLAATCKRLVKELGVNFLRLDEFAGTFDSCHNPAHHHETPYGSVRWTLQALKKIRAAVDEVDPTVALFAEGPSDVTAMYLDGALSGWSTGPDIAPGQLATPSLRGMGYSSGQIECAINGFIPGHLYACNRGGWANGYHEKLWGEGIEPMPEGYPKMQPGQLWPGTTMRWHELRSTFADAVEGIDPTDQVPVAVGLDPKRFAAQLWRSEKYWLLVAGDVAGERPKQPYRVRLPELPVDVKHAFEFDTATLKMRDANLERRSDGIFVTMTSGFGAVLLPKPECPPIVLLDDVPVLSRGRTESVKLEAFAPWRGNDKPVQVSTEIVGLETSPETVTLPASISISAPTDAPPGYYALRITGDCLRVKRWFIYDPATLIDQLQPEIIYGAY